MLTLYKGSAAVQDATTPGVFESLDLFKAWDRDYYHPAAKPFYDRMVKRMVDQLACEPDDLILDAGCGPGEHSIRVAREGLRVTALDVSEAVLEEAQRRAAAAGAADQITFVKGDLTKLEFESESFQAIVCWGVVIHIQSIEEAIDELIRVLKPRGRLALYVTNAAALDHRLLKWGRRLLRKPPARYEQLGMGRGRRHGTGGDELWVWHIDVAALSNYLELHGMKRISRMAGEFTETQRRARGWLRTCLLLANRAYSYLRLPPGPCADNLLIFEKNG